MKRLSIAPAAFILIACVAAAGAAEPRIRLAWANDMLTVHAPHVPGERVTIRYLEAYCRPGSTDRDWSETVIKHQARLVSASADGREIALEDKLADGVVVQHKITAGDDAISFEVQARNPTASESQAHWAQPCVQIDRFTGRTQQDYIPQCFLLVDGKPTRLPTQPWATKARYTPGQVYCPKHVDRNDVNPRPLSEVIPSHALMGCFSADGKWILATAWEPYHELFQGVAVCLHTDFRIGGLKVGESKSIRGKLYLTDAGIDKLVDRYRRDFPEHWENK